MNSHIVQSSHYYFLVHLVCNVCVSLNTLRRQSKTEAEWQRATDLKNQHMKVGNTCVDHNIVQESGNMLTVEEAQAFELCLSIPTIMHRQAIQASLAQK